MNSIETRTRKVKQSYRRFSDEKKREIVTNILNRPSGVTLEQACNENGIVNPLYYKWKENMLRNGVVTNVFKSRSQEPRQNKRYSDDEKKNIIQTIENLPEGVTKKEMFRKMGINKPDYYTWRKKYGVMGMIRPSTVRQTVNSSRKILHTVTLNVEVSSIMELISFCNDIVRTPKVKTILSVE
jgi:transposase-like protein